MKCPKCYFIGFDNGQRCKNCGYQFSLAVDRDPVELPLKTGDEPLGPLADFPIDANELAREPRQARGPDLPLFGGRAADDDRPLVSLPASPRAPVAVRKSSPVVRAAPARSAQPYEPELDLELPEPAARTAPAPAHARRDRTHDREENADAAAVSAGAVVASAWARLGAALLDLTLVCAVDATVLFFTLKICGLTFDQWRVIPPVPFLAFVAMLDGGYMAGATAASGQTLGKLVTGIKVVTADPDAPTDRVPLGQAIVRSVGYLVSAFPAGLGFVPAFVGEERRALHDRLAHTRVVHV
jgi:uncharacterized RDD family membrane protein YckC